MYLDEDDLLIGCNLLKFISNGDLKYSLENRRSWEEFKNISTLSDGIIVYGRGWLCEYFLDVYDDIRVRKIVDRNSHTVYCGEIRVYPVSVLEDEDRNTPVLITPIGPAEKICNDLKALGFNNVFILADLEWQKDSIKEIVRYIESNPKELERYKRYANRKKRRICELRFNDRLLHLERIVNLIIDSLDNDELKKSLIIDQMCYWFKCVNGNSYIPDLYEPRTFNEKNLDMQIRQADNLLYSKVSDKFELKQYASDIVGKDHIVPVLGIWDDPRDIDWEQLPDQFVLKATSGGDSSRVIVIRNKSGINKSEIVNEIRQWFWISSGVYAYAFNGVYKHVKQRIFAEEMIKSDKLLDYKIWMFHGKPEFYYVESQLFADGHISEQFMSYYWMDGTPFNAKTKWFPENSDNAIGVPVFWDEMIDKARKLAEPFEFVRVDFMVTESDYYLAELTLTPSGGKKEFDTMELERRIGDLW